MKNSLLMELIELMKKKKKVINDRWFYAMTMFPLFIVCLRNWNILRCTNDKIFKYLIIELNKVLSKELKYF